MHLRSPPHHNITEREGVYLSSTARRRHFHRRRESSSSCSLSLLTHESFSEAFMVHHMDWVKCPSHQKEYSSRRFLSDENVDANGITMEKPNGTVLILIVRPVTRVDISVGRCYQNGKRAKKRRDRNCTNTAHRCNTGNYGYHNEKGAEEGGIGWLDASRSLHCCPSFGNQRRLTGSSRVSVPPLTLSTQGLQAINRCS